MRATVKGFKIFPLRTGGNCLVLELSSPEIEELHEYARSLGCTHDYPEYTPHVTLTYAWPSDQLPDMDLGNINLIFDHWTVKPLNPDYIPGKEE
jgi:2'-5' RNA ligase